MSKLDKDQVIAAFTEAYTAANGKAPEIEAKGGWYSVDGGKNMRLAQLAEMAESMGASKATKAEKPAAKTEKAPAKKAAPKVKPVAKKAKKVKGGFSVKSFWNQQLEENNPGNTKVR